MGRTMNNVYSECIRRVLSLGGVTEPIDLANGGFAADEDKREELFKTMKKGTEHRALMAAAIPVRASLTSHSVLLHILQLLFKLQNDGI